MSSITLEKCALELSNYDVCSTHNASLMGHNWNKMGYATPIITKKRAMNPPAPRSRVNMIPSLTFHPPGSDNPSKSYAELASTGMDLIMESWAKNSHRLFIPFQISSMKGFLLQPVQAATCTHAQVVITFTEQSTHFSKYYYGICTFCQELILVDNVNLTRHIARSDSKFTL